MYNRLETDGAQELVQRRPLSRAESARINGAKSRGPTSAEGKARSSRNALRHGLLSKRIAPIMSNSGERADYEAHLRGMLADYQPQTGAEVNVFEVMARDCVRIARIGQVANSVLLNVLPKNAARLQQTLTDLRFEIAALEQALKSQQTTDRFDLADEQKSVIQNLITEQLWTWDTEREKGVVDDNRESLQVYVQVNPAALTLHLAEHVFSVLSGTIELLDAESQRWKLLLQYLLDRTMGRLKSTVFADQMHEEQCRTDLVESGAELSVLARLIELEAAAFRQMDRHISLLMKLRQLRA